MSRAALVRLAASLLRPAAGLVLATGLSGCVTLRLEGSDQEVRVVRGFGILRVELAQPQLAIAGSVSGVGIVGAPLGWSAGYTRQRWAVLGRGCRTVVWPPPGGMDERIRAELASAAGVCVMADDDANTVSFTGRHVGEIP